MKKFLVTGVITLCILLTYLYPYQMLNPGELVKGHQQLNNKCLACHKPFWGIDNNKCVSCHKLSEIGKDSVTSTEENLEKKKILFHQQFSKQECTSCHTDHKGIVPEHSISHFKHVLLSSEMISNCNSCHQKPSDKIHLQISSSCKNCHTTKGWKSSVIFNHDMLQGVDKNKCTACHLTPNNAFHQAIKDNCDKCHTTQKWIPSTFDHTKYFQLDKNHNAECKTCHTNNNFKVYTCYGCHEHSESKIRDEHNEEGIENFSNCITCHKSANKHDISHGEGNLEREKSSGEGHREKDDD